MPGVMIYFSSEQLAQLHTTGWSIYSDHRGLRAKHISYPETLEVNTKSQSSSNSSSGTEGTRRGRKRSGGKGSKIRRALRRLREQLPLEKNPKGNKSRFQDPSSGLLVRPYRGECAMSSEEYERLPIDFDYSSNRTNRFYEEEMAERERQAMLQAERETDGRNANRRAEYERAKKNIQAHYDAKFSQKSRSKTSSIQSGSSKRKEKIAQKISDAEEKLSYLDKARSTNSYSPSVVSTRRPGEKEHIKWASRPDVKTGSACSCKECVSHRKRWDCNCLFSRRCFSRASEAAAPAPTRHVDYGYSNNNKSFKSRDPYAEMDAAPHAWKRNKGLHDSGHVNLTFDILGRD